MLQQQQANNQVKNSLIIFLLYFLKAGDVIISFFFFDALNAAFPDTQVLPCACQAQAPDFLGLDVFLFSKLHGLAFFFFSKHLDPSSFPAGPWNCAWLYA